MGIPDPVQVGDLVGGEHTLEHDETLKVEQVTLRVAQARHQHR
jgi:hypothetical protein